MIAAVVVVVHEAGDSLLQITRRLVRDLVHFLLDTLVVALQLARWFVGAKALPGCDGPLPSSGSRESPGYVARSVVA